MKQFFKNIIIGALSTFIGFSLLFISFIFFAVVLVNGLKGRAEPIEDNSVLYLDLHGELTERTKPFDFNFLSTSPFSDDERGMGLYELTKALSVAKADSKIKGLYLELRELDAGWASSEALRRAIVDFKTSGKFVYAYSALMDEKTYYLASAADKIFLQPNGEIEFNGLGVDGVFLKGLLAKLDVQPRIFRVGKFKSAVEPFLYEKMSDENRQQNQILINDVWAVFKNGILRPKLEGNDVEQMAAGLEINSPSDALNKGLVQQLAFEDEVLDLISKETGDEQIRDHLVSPGQLLAQYFAKVKTKNKIVVLFAEGDIVEGSGDRNSVGSESFQEDLEEIMDDENVKAVVVRINSPGGDALASDNIWREIMIANKEIPVVASMGDVAASGGYYIAAGARHIFAEASTLTGSIGVFGLMFETKDFFQKKLGVNFDQVVTHPHADLGNPNRSMTEVERNFIQSSVERVYRRFIEVVKSSRQLPESTDASTFAEGRVWSGAQAKEMKLVDDIGGLDSAVKKAAEFAELGEGDYELETYPRQRDSLEEILDLMSGQVTRSLIKGTVLEILQISQLQSPQLQQAQHQMLHPLSKLRSGVYARLPFDLKIQ